MGLQKEYAENMQLPLPHLPKAVASDTEEDHKSNQKVSTPHFSQLHCTSYN